ncbi:hypothetical protein EJV47_18760 [Hymenobacter gummosus]|uniref:Glycosyltransferase RgtA/B/C/D-like domain-containing protein n=1 Tax=Hymenobacter gummosus TaxID=1776032 RepID=A0A431TZ98_9BACT|nr:DUF6056 family protein [Hymenobacter gummosus]RTQ47466.1 hypothetical protein EJV47_18760 [Hymenobacter gummosus]
MLLTSLTTYWRRLFTSGNQRRMAWGLLVLGLLPFVVLSFYSHPALDDYSDALLRNRLGFWEAQRNLYLTWTGRYTTSLLLTELSPVYYRWMGIYWLVPLGALLVLGGSLYVLLSTLTGSFWRRSTRLLASGIIVVLWLLRASSIAEVLYWYNGVAVYTLPTALLLLWLAAMLRYWQAPRPAAARWLLVALLSVALAGTNEFLALGALSIVGLLWLWELVRRGHRHYALLILLALLGLAVAVSFLAPGNMQRASTINRVIPLYWIALGSIGSSAYMLLNWLSNGVLLIGTALVLPALGRLAAAPNVRLRWLSRIHPVLMALMLVGILVLMSIPSYWATGGMMPLRARAMLYFVFIISWFVLIINVLIYRHQSLNHPVTRYIRRSYVWPARLSSLLWLWLLVYLATDHNVRLLRENMGQGSNNAIVAYRDWFSGEARSYHAEQTRRYQLLASNHAQRIQLSPLKATPPSLLYYDITTDSTYWGNIVYARYFGKQAIWIGPGGMAPPQ